MDRIKSPPQPSGVKPVCAAMSTRPHSVCTLVDTVDNLHSPWKPLPTGYPTIHTVTTNKLASLWLLMNHQSSVCADSEEFPQAPAHTPDNRPRQPNSVSSLPNQWHLRESPLRINNLPSTASLWISPFPSDAHQSPKPSSLCLSHFPQEETASAKMPKLFGLASADIRQKYNYLTLSTPSVFSILLQTLRAQSCQLILLIRITCPTCVTTISPNP